MGHFAQRVLEHPIKVVHMSMVRLEIENTGTPRLLGVPLVSLSTHSKKDKKKDGAVLLLVFMSFCPLVGPSLSPKLAVVLRQ